MKDKPRAPSMPSLYALLPYLFDSNTDLFRGEGRYERVDPDAHKKGFCRNCGEPKNHNNLFCSGDCCREYKKRGNTPRPAPVKVKGEMNGLCNM